MTNNNTVYAQKTKLREMIFLAYRAEQISRDSAIAQIGVSVRQFIRLNQRLGTDKNLSHKLCNRSSNHSIDATTKSELSGIMMLQLRHLVSFLFLLST